MFGQPQRSLLASLRRLALPALGLLLFAGPVQADQGRKVTKAAAGKKVSGNAANARGNTPTATQGRPKTDASSRLELKRLDLKSVTGTRIGLELGTFSRNRRMQADVAVYFVDGAQRTELWRGKPTFAQTQGGFSSTATVDVRGRNAQRGELEAVVLDCADSPQCRRKVRLSGGDLVLSGQPEFRTGGRNRTLSLLVKNSGPNPASNCVARLKIDGQVRAEQRVNALRLNEDQSVRFDYPNNDQNKNADVVLDCSDLVPSNNNRRLRLR